MSNNPTATLNRPLTKPKINFCLAINPKNSDWVCTRIDKHGGHCCDETAGESWNDRGQSFQCGREHNHSKEKGLVDA